MSYELIDSEKLNQLILSIELLSKKVKELSENSNVAEKENYTNSENVEADKKDEVEKKYEDMFSLYLEAIDKHMMDNVYKKVKNDTATGFEREA